MKITKALKRDRKRNKRVQGIGSSVRLLEEIKRDKAETLRRRREQEEKERRILQLEE